MVTFSGSVCLRIPLIICLFLLLVAADPPSSDPSFLKGKAACYPFGKKREKIGLDLSLNWDLVLRTESRRSSQHLSMCMALSNLMNSHYYFPDFRWDLRPLQRVNSWDYMNGELTTTGNFPSRLLLNTSISLELLDPRGQRIFGEVWEAVEPRANGSVSSRTEGDRLHEIWTRAELWLEQVLNNLQDDSSLVEPPALGALELYTPIFDNSIASLLHGTTAASLFFFQDFSESSGPPSPVAVAVLSLTGSLFFCV